MTRLTGKACQARGLRSSGSGSSGGSDNNPHLSIPVAIWRRHLCGVAAVAIGEGGNVRTEIELLEQPADPPVCEVTWVKN